MSDNSVFPNDIYKETVLAPLFEGVKKHFAGAVAQINRAHLVMLAETGILSGDTASEIAIALADIDADLDIGKLEYTGEFEDYFFVVEGELRQRLGPDIAGALHTARSRNDMDHTVFKMVLRARLDALLELGLGLADALIEKAEVEKETLIVAYTHGQPAQPSTFGHYLSGVIEVLLRDLKRLHDARKLLQKCPMGAAAITTSGFGIDRHRVAELLGFEAPLQNSYACIAAVDYISGVYSALKLTFLHLGRVVQDFQFWSSFEVGQLYVPNEFVQISSIMPQKRNPVPIEHLRLLSSLTIGRCDIMVNTMHNTPFTDMNDSEGEVQQAGFGAFDSGGRVLALFGALVPALTICADKVRKNTEKSCITITELADNLVRCEDISFRQAHEIAAGIAQSVMVKNLPLYQGFDAFKCAFEAQLARSPKMNEAEFSRAVSPENFVAVRDRFGGPALKPMNAALASYRDELKNLSEPAQNHRNELRAAQQKLTMAFERIKINDKGA